jgi:MFS family permease
MNEAPTIAQLDPPPWREVFAGRRGRLVTGLLILEALVAVYALVISTIMPAIRADLGGTNLYGFVFAVWSLAAVMTIPISGHAADRFGPRAPLLVAMGVFIAGLAVAGIAPNIYVLIIGVFLQGAAGGAFYALSLGTVAKTFPQEIRARVLALLATMWILPGLVGPPLGAFIATHFGWRWAFAVPLPVLALCSLLVLPALRGIRAEVDAADIPIRWSVQLALGAALVLGGLTLANLWAVPAFIVGIAIAVPAARRILPRGILRAAPGLPATAGAMFLLSFAFVGAESFVPLMLTSLRGFSLAEAGLVITVTTVAWAAGSWWQSRVAPRVALGRLETIGAILVAAGIATMAATGLSHIPAVFAYVAWLIAGTGMGIAFPTLPLAAMTVTEEGREAGQLSSTLLTDTIGMAVGSGLGGASIALATRPGGPGLRPGIVGAFAIALVGISVLIAIAHRIPDGRAVAGSR